ncbi:hypothetical protein B0H11DRAFT_1918440 [Mycena galericulata]|nr:hypothetical protein B0H11DRAFT_1918440 [Mycena galericulata]
MKSEPFVLLLDLIGPSLLASLRINTGRTNPPTQRHRPRPSSPFPSTGRRGPLSRELLPKSFFRVLNAERVRAEYRAKCKNWEDYVDGDGEDGGGKKKWRKLDGEEWEETKISPARGWRVLTRPPPLAIGRLHRPDGLISIYAVAFPAGHRWIESDMRPAHPCAPQRRPTTRAGKKVLLLLYMSSSAPTVP